MPKEKAIQRDVISSLFLLLLPFFFYKLLLLTGNIFDNLSIEPLWLLILWVVNLEPFLCARKYLHDEVSMHILSYYLSPGEDKQLDLSSCIFIYCYCFSGLIFIQDNILSSHPHPFFPCLSFWGWEYNMQMLGKIYASADVDYLLCFNLGIHLITVIGHELSPSGPAIKSSVAICIPWWCNSTMVSSKTSHTLYPSCTSR